MSEKDQDSTTLREPVTATPNGTVMQNDKFELPKGTHHSDEHEEAVEARAPDTTASPVEQEPEEKRRMTGWKWVLVAIAINSGSFLYGLDNTIVADIQAAVVENFHEPGKLAWIGSAFPLGSVVFILPIGKAYGMFDVKWLWLGSIVLFEVGSAICGGAPNMNALIVGRVIAGAGGAGMYLGGLNLLAIYTTIRERPLYMALNGVVWGTGTILGPVIGGAFADSSATWRWAFYINLVIGALFTPVYLFLIQGFQPQPNISRLQKLKTLDWLGIVLFTAVYTTLLLALTFGGVQWSWNNYRTIVTLVFFGLTLLGFCLSQAFPPLTSKANRIFPTSFLHSRSMILLYILTACSGAAIFVPIYYIPIYFQFAKGDTALEAAVRLLPFIFLLVFFILLNGAAMPAFGYYMPWFVFAGALTLVGGALMTTVSPSTSTSAIYGYSVLIAMGGGATSQAAYSIAPAKVQPHQVPDAIAFINIAQIGGIVIALTVSGTIFQNFSFHLLSVPLAGQGYTSDQIHGIVTGVGSTIFASLAPDLQVKAQEAIVATISRIYYLVVAAGALGLVLSLGLKREKLFMKMEAGG
ncbi:MAG: hypothetical protein M1830_009348 [Pleopsidium flavum]|nr:MAG: hypothetical protein M1830_009348 [Pleopsidium flavum]